MNAVGLEDKASQPSKQAHEGQEKRVELRRETTMREFASPDLREGCAVYIQVVFQTMQQSMTSWGTFFVSSLHGFMLVFRALPPPPLSSCSRVFPCLEVGCL